MIQEVSPFSDFTICIVSNALKGIPRDVPWELKRESALPKIPPETRVASHTEVPGIKSDRRSPSNEITVDHCPTVKALQVGCQCSPHLSPLHPKLQMGAGEWTEVIMPCLAVP